MTTTRLFYLFILFRLSSRPSAREQEVDQGGDIGDADVAILVAVGGLVADGIAAEQQVDQGGDISDAHIAITIHVTTHNGHAHGEVVGIQFTEHRLLVAVS